MTTDEILASFFETKPEYLPEEKEKYLEGTRSIIYYYNRSKQGFWEVNMETGKWVPIDFKNSIQFGKILTGLISKFPVDTIKVLFTYSKDNFNCTIRLIDEKDYTAKGKTLQRALINAIKLLVIPQ